MRAQLGSTQVHQQLSAMIVLLGRVTTTRSPIHRVLRAWLAFMQSLEPLACAVGVLRVATVLYRVVRTWMSVTHVCLDRIQTQAPRRALSVLEALQISTVIPQQTARNVPLARTLVVARQSAMNALPAKSTAMKMPQHRARCARLVSIGTIAPCLASVDVWSARPAALT